MPHVVYILRSARMDRHCVGSTEDVEKRVRYHNRGLSPYTRGKGPWELVYTEAFAARREALSRERQIKQMKSRRYIKGLIQKSKRPQQTAPGA